MTPESFLTNLDLAMMEFRATFKTFSLVDLDLVRSMLWRHFGPAYDVCRRLHYQRCADCTEWSCTDNTNPERPRKEE